MPRAKSIHAYPQELWTFCEGCALRHEQFQIEVDNWKQAAAMQGKFYAFRGAINREAELIKSTGLGGPAWAEKIANIQVWANETVCWWDRSTREGKLTVSYMHKSDTPDAKLYQKAKRISPDTPDTEVQAVFERIQERLKGEGK